MKRTSLIVLLMYGMALASPAVAVEPEGQTAQPGTQQDVKKPADETKPADQTAPEEKKKKKGSKKEGGDSEPGCD